MTVSIIIPVRKLNKNLEACIDSCLELDYPQFEIFVLPDEPMGINFNKVEVVPTGSVSPGEKRNMAFRKARGEVLAFLDDDTVVSRDWLKKALRNFKQDDVAAVGGPGVTPETDTLREKASGAVYSSILASGRYIYRYLPGKRQEVDDYPSCNLFVRRSVMEELGGFKTDFWPGEDTHLCLEITQNLNKKIIYDPEVLIYHHRRSLFLPHLKQIVNYALHRGYFAKRFPQTSLKFSYFVPSLFVIGLALGGISSLFFPILRAIYFAVIGAYVFLIALFSLNRNLKIIPFTFSGLILTHLCYGVWFIKGFLAKRLKEEKAI